MSNSVSVADSVVCSSPDLLEKVHPSLTEEKEKCKYETGFLKHADLSPFGIEVSAKHLKYTCDIQETSRKQHRRALDIYIKSF